MTSVTIDAESLRQLVAEAQQGDQVAADRLVRGHDAWVRSAIYAVAGRVDLVDDIAQQVWTRAWERLGTLQDPRQLRSWLYSIARNTAIDAGIAGINGDGNAELIRSRSFHTYLSYFLPGGKWAVSAGYGQAEARNLDRFTASALAGKVALAPKIQFAVVSAFYDPLPYLRFALEVSQNRDTYNGASAGNSQANRFAVNNRTGLFSYLMF